MIKKEAKPLGTLADQTGGVFTLRQRKRRVLTLHTGLGLVKLAVDYGQEPVPTMVLPAAAGMGSVAAPENHAGAGGESVFHGGGDPPPLPGPPPWPRAGAWRWMTR